MAENQGSTIREIIEGHSVENNSYVSMASFPRASGFHQPAWCPLLLTVVAYGNHIFAKKKKKKEEYFLISFPEMFLSSSLYKAMLQIWMKTNASWCQVLAALSLLLTVSLLLFLSIKINHTIKDQESQGQIVCLINSFQNFSVLSRLRFILFLNRFSTLISMDGEYIHSLTQLLAAHSRHSFLFYIFVLDCCICNGNSYLYLNHNLSQPVQLHLIPTHFTKPYS